MQSWICRHICPRRCLETVGACPSCGNPICRPKVTAPPSSSATQAGARAERGSGCASLPERDVGAALEGRTPGTCAVSAGGHRKQTRGGAVSLITKLQSNSAMLQSHRQPRGWHAINKYNFLRKGGFRLERVFTTTLKRRGRVGGQGGGGGASLVNQSSNSAREIILSDPASL